jgi:ppGpp synthetase/RelA/SpoT-type nucleotidyltranferase
MVMAKMKLLDHFLSLWDRESIIVFPRKAMGLFSHGQVIIKSRTELEELIEESGELDCFIQTHTVEDRGQGIFYLIFIDIDAPGDLARAGKIRCRVNTYIKREYELRPYIQFSGYKGYHILVPVKVTKLPPAKFSDFLKFCQMKLSLGYCDRQLLGDVVRLVRIPGTYNSKAVEKGLDGRVQIIQEWDGRELDPGLLWEQFKLHKLSESLGEKKRPTPSHTFNYRIRPIIQELIDKARQGYNLEHSERFAILLEMINNGYTDEQIHEVFKTIPDYNEKKTQYFIDHARKNGYRPYSMKKLLEVVRK